MSLCMYSFHLAGSAALLPFCPSSAVLHVYDRTCIILYRLQPCNNFRALKTDLRKSDAWSLVRDPCALAGLWPIRGAQPRGALLRIGIPTQDATRGSAMTSRSGAPRCSATEHCGRVFSGVCSRHRCARSILTNNPYLYATAARTELSKCSVLRLSLSAE